MMMMMMMMIGVDSAGLVVSRSRLTCASELVDPWQIRCFHHDNAQPVCPGFIAKRELQLSPVETHRSASSLLGIRKKIRERFGKRE